jgi:hypothetical protein
MAFDFPNPPGDESVTNPETGVTYKYDHASDTWVIELREVTSAFLNAQENLEALEELGVENIIAALQVAQQDIIELKSKVSSLELTSFLILE